MKPSDIPEERHFKRVLWNGNIYWEKEYEIKCYSCGKTEHIKAIVYEGKYDPDLVHTVIDEKTGEERKTYPTFAPQGSRISEWVIPEGWTQSTHLSNEYYPHETLNAIYMNLQQMWRVVMFTTQNYNWAELINEGNMEIDFGRDLSLKSFILHPIKYIRDLFNPQIATLTYKSEAVKPHFDKLWGQAWQNAEKQFISPLAAFEMWHDYTSKHFAQWICPTAECHIEMGRRNYNELARHEGLEQMKKVKIG